MLPFFRKRLSAEDFSKMLLVQLQSNLDISDQCKQDLPHDIPENDIAEERSYLRVFLCCYLLTRYVSDIAIKNKIISIYSVNIDSYWPYSISHSCLHSNIGYHISYYSLAIKRHDSNGPAWVIGQAYASLCEKLIALPISDLIIETGCEWLPDPKGLERSGANPQIIEGIKQALNMNCLPYSMNLPIILIGASEFAAINNAISHITNKYSLL